MTPRTVACVIGTRPEAIKMAPVVHALHASNWARCLVIVTAQHRDLLDPMLTRLNVRVDHDLNLMTKGQTLSQLLARMLSTLDNLLTQENATIVLAQGDTTTVLGAALCAFHRNIPFGHVEAGLRTHELTQPFPEEGYRQMVSRIARWHFAPTTLSAANLRAEGIAPERIHVTGNTGIDTLFASVASLAPLTTGDRRMILVTVHRRENFGKPLQAIFRALLVIADQHEDVVIVYPVHPNPNVQDPAHRLLGGHPRILLLPPQDYFEFVDLMRQATLILTDSGGIQEEAPSLGKPVLILRNQTERPEGVEAGVARIVGTDTRIITGEASRLLKDHVAYDAMAQCVSPYGDGQAASRIVEIMCSDVE